MKSKLIFTIVYISITIIEILADLNHHFYLTYLTKPLILLSLLFYIQLTPDERVVHKRNVFVAGITAALLGDILLMIRSVDLFIPGLGAFLIMQMLYSYVFIFENRITLFSKKALISKIPFLAFALILYLILYPNLHDLALKVAVGIYAYSIATMAWLTTLRKSRVSDQSHLLVLSGALLFMISDSLIAIDKFLYVISFKTIWVMGSYAAAQYLISIGYLKTK